MDLEKYISKSSEIYYMYVPRYVGYGWLNLQPASSIDLLLSIST